jgi:hypothetical protein
MVISTSTDLSQGYDFAIDPIVLKGHKTFVFQSKPLKASFHISLQPCLEPALFKSIKDLLILVGEVH